MPIMMKKRAAIYEMKLRLVEKIVHVGLSRMTVMIQLKRTWYMRNMNATNMTLFQ